MSDFLICLSLIEGGIVIPYSTLNSD